MEIIELAHTIIQGYALEACNILNYDFANIRIIYVNHIDDIQGIPQFTAITHDGCMVVNDTWAIQCVKNEKPTIIRNEVYCKVRLLYKQSKKPGSFNQYSNDAIYDAIAFSTSLLSLKGLMLPIPPDLLGASHLLERTKDLIKEEINLDSIYYQVPKELVQQNNFCKFKLTSNSELEYAERYYSKPRISTIRVIDNTEKGTETNPFEDIIEASNYIKELENDAYSKDDLLKDIATQQYFYDLKFHQFRVPWASPYVAFYKDENIPSNGFIVNQNEMLPNGKFHFTLKPNLYGRKFLYRGQSQDYPKPCTPNLFRDDAKTYYLDDLIWSQEMELLLMTHPLVKLLENGVTIMHDHFSILMNLVGLTQHYYHKTRYLDLTSDMEAAQFFATTDYCSKKDEYTPVHGTSKLGMIYCYELQMPGAFAKQEGYELSVIGKQVFMRSGAQHGFLLGMNKGMDLKTMPQVKKFYFRHHPNISDDIFKKSDYGKKYFTIDILEEAWKNDYKKRMEDGIVSSDTVRLNVSMNPGETFESISKKLKDSNITIDDSYHPSFSEELIDKYYESIKQGWWEDFCSDIYFHGGDAALYKDCLLRIPKQPEYKWAFER